MYVCVCMYVCMHVCMHTCTYVCVYVWMYLCMYEWMYLCMYVFMYVCMSVCMYVCMYAFSCRFVCSGPSWPSASRCSARCISEKVRPCCQHPHQVGQSSLQTAGDNASPVALLALLPLGRSGWTWFWGQVILVEPSLCVLFSSRLRAPGAPVYPEAKCLHLHLCTGTLHF